MSRRALLHNGVPVTDCAVAEGDTLLVEQTVGFLVEERLIALDPFPGFDALPRFPFGAPDPFGMVGESPASWALRAALASAAAADEHVLLLGESGSGKEVAAALLHGLSSRRRGPLVARNAATMPESLLDAELFGSARDFPNRGSPERPGLVGEAHGGHLLLDEIGELPQGHQAHLLRVLDQHGEYHRLGEVRPRVSDFRLIAATNREVGALKHDFLARFPRQVRVPSLDERRSDVPLLIRALVARLARRTPERLRPYLDDDDPRRLHLEPRLLDALLRHSYRLHVRELHRLLELSLATSGPSCLELTPAVVEELAAAQGVPNPPPPTRTPPPAPPPAPPPRSAHPPSAGPPRPLVGDVEAALAETEGNVSHAALRLGISRFALIRLLRNYGLARRDDSEPE